MGLLHSPVGKSEHMKVSAPATAIRPQHSFSALISLTGLTRL